MEADFPEKDKKRALRRHHRQRMIRKAKTIFHKYWSWGNTYTQHELERKANKEADNLAICSCWVCQHHEPSIQEKSIDITTKEELEEINEETETKVS